MRNMINQEFLYIINPRRALQRGLLCVCVCMTVCVCVYTSVRTRYSGSTRGQKCNERYRRVKRQIWGNIILAFFL